MRKTEIIVLDERAEESVIKLEIASYNELIDLSSRFKCLGVHHYDSISYLREVKHFLQKWSMKSKPCMHKGIISSMALKCFSRQPSPLSIYTTDCVITKSQCNIQKTFLMDMTLLLSWNKA